MGCECCACRGLAFFGATVLSFCYGRFARPPDDAAIFRLAAPSSPAQIASSEKPPLRAGPDKSQICTFRHRSASRNATLRSLPRIRFVSSRDVHRRIASPNCVAELAALLRRLTLLVMLALCRARREPESSETLSSLIVSFLNASLARIKAHITSSPPRYAYRLRGRESELFGRW